MEAFFLADIPLWAVLLLLWYAGAPTFVRESGITLGLLGILIAPLPWMPIYYVFYHLDQPGWSWSTIFALVASAFLGFFVHGITAAERSRLQSRRNEEAKDLAKQVLASPMPGASALVPYFLYLRPFAVDGAMPAQYGREDSMDHAQHLDLVVVLHAAVEPYGRLVAVGGRSGADEIARFEGSESWLGKVEKLAENAELIVIAPLISDPSKTTGTLEEIGLVRRRFLEKCVWLMPETMIDKRCYFGWKDPNPLTISYIAHYDYKSAWERIQTKLARDPNFDIRLPDYDSDGMLFTLNAEGDVDRSVSFSTSCTLRKVRKARRQLDSLVGLSRMNRSGRSTRGSYLKLQCARFRRFLLPVAWVLIFCSAFMLVQFGPVLGMYIFGGVGAAIWWLCATGQSEDDPHGGHVGQERVEAMRLGVFGGVQSRVSAQVSALLDRLRTDEALREVAFLALWILGWGVGMWFGVREIFYGEHGLFMTAILVAWAIFFGIGGLVFLVVLIGMVVDYVLHRQRI